MSSKLLVVGTMAYDTIQTPFTKVNKILGGAATYIALASSKFKLNCSVISIVGKDFKKEHLDLLKDRGVDVSGIDILKTRDTFHWSGEYFSDMKTRKTIDTQLNVLEDFDPIVPRDFLTSDILILGNLHPDLQIKTLTQIKTRPKLTILDTMNFWIENFRTSLDKIISMVDVVCINDEEAIMLTGENSIPIAAKEINRMGPKHVIIKKGEKGASLFSSNQSFFVPSFPINEVVDPTGAGDSFVGGFASYLAEQEEISFKEMKLAMIFACAMASFTIEKFGTENLINIPFKSIQLRVNAIKELINFGNK